MKSFYWGQFTTSMGNDIKQLAKHFYYTSDIFKNARLKQLDKKLDILKEKEKEAELKLKESKIEVTLAKTENNTAYAESLKKKTDKTKENEKEKENNLSTEKDYSLDKDSKSSTENIDKSIAKNAQEIQDEYEILCALSNCLESIIEPEKTVEVDKKQEKVVEADIEPEKTVEADKKQEKAVEADIEQEKDVEADKKQEKSIKTDKEFDICVFAKEIELKL